MAVTDRDQPHVLANAGEQRLVCLAVAARK